MVSVIIPYNVDRGFLQAAIDSVQQQSYRDFEIILSHSEGSGGYNMNRGIEKAKGEFLCYLCEDDLLHKDSLKDRVVAMGDNDFIHGRGIQFDENRRETLWTLTNPYAEFNSMLQLNGMMGGTTMYRRELFEEYMWDEELWTGGEYDFHLKLLYHNKKLGFCNDIVYKYRRHPLQKSLGNLSTAYQAQRREQIEMIRNRYRT